MSEYRKQTDTDKCYFCPKRTDIEVHHIVPQRFNGTDKRENLVALCDRCHEKIEVLYDARFYETLGISDEAGERKNHFPCELCDGQALIRMSLNTGYPLWLCEGCAVGRVENSKDDLMLAHGYDDLMDGVAIHDVVDGYSVDEIKAKIEREVTHDR